jgi:WD40 repeat protein
VSEELGRYLRGETILARPIGRLARAGRWCRRNPLIAALTATAGLLLVLVAVVATVGYVNTSNALKGEAHQRKLAEDALYESQQSEARAVAARQQAVAAQQQAQQSAATSLVEQVDLLRRDRAAGWTWKGLENLSKALGMGIKFPDVVKLRSLASSCLMGVDLRQVAAFAPGENSFCAAFSPDGKQLAIAQYKAQAYATCKVTVVSLSDAQTRSYSYSPSMAWQIKHGWVQDGGRSLAFSPDGRWLVVGTRSGWLHRWDLGHNGSAPASWQAHEESVDDLAFSPDGRSLYSASFHEALARWDAANGWKMAARRESKASRGIALSRDGSRLVIAEDALCWLDPNTLKPSGKTIGLKAGGLIRYCGATGLLAAAWNNGIALIDEERAEPVPVRTLSDPEFQVAHSSGMCGLATSPDGSLVASSDTDGRMKLWDVASGRFLYRVAFPGAGNVAPAFSPDGRHIAATADLRVLLFELGGLDTCSTAGLGESAVRTIAVSHDGRSLATLAGGDGSAGKVCCWDADTGGTRSQWHVNAGFDPGMEASLSFHPSGEVLAAGGYVENLLLLRVLDSKVEEWLERRTSTSFVFGADGRTLWRVRNSDEVVGWDPASGKELSHWSNRLANVFTGRATIHTLAAGKSWVVAGSATTGAILLRTSDGQMETRWDSPGGAVTAVAIRRDDSLAALATEKGTIRVVRVPDGHVLGDQKAHADRIASLAFAQDGTSLASASHDGTVCCFRIGDGLVERVVALSFDNRPVEAVCFAQQGRLLAILLRGESGVRVVHLDRLRAGLGALALDWQAGG